ncbi:hypothetical protein KAI87_10165, partial [Myxococcota bacterium]|nr:hypothetical protein [Myxococcota bacterium]
VGTEDCAAISEACSDNGTGVAYCNAPLAAAAEYEACGAGIAECNDGLVCDQNDLFGGSFCVIDCTGDTSVCAGTQYCDTELSGYGLTPHDFCWDISDRHGMCISDDGCNTDLTCMAISGESPECVVDCASTAIGTVGTCGTETCLQGPYIDAELTGDDVEIPCSGLTDETTCSADFECMFTGVDASNVEQFTCAQFIGLCGVEGEILDTFTESTDDVTGTMEDAVNAGIADPNGNDYRDTLCNLPGSAVFCGDMAGGDAEVECASTGWGLTYSDSEGNPFPCSGEGDCFLIGGECMNFTSGAVCGSSAELCVPFCETFDGVDIVDACPSATHACVIPAAEIGFPIIEGGQAAPVECTTADTIAECGTGYICTEFSDGKFCTRQRKVCEIL